MLNEESRVRPNGAHWIDHKGERILFHDFRGYDPSKDGSILDDGRKIVRSQPENSLLELVDVTGAVFNTKVVDDMKEYAAGNKPFSKKCAVVGVDGLQKIILQAVITFSGRNFELFSDIEQAKDWLIKNE